MIHKAINYVCKYNKMNNENQILDELIVSTLEDENDGDFSQGDLSLREAIAQAESGDTITFDPNLSDGTIVLTSDDLIIDKSLTIKGLGADRLTIDAGEDNITEFEPYSDGVRVFNVDDGNSDTLADVTISGLTITGGNTGGFVSGGNTINDRGGGIFNTENLEIDGSVIRDNQAISYGGGIYNEGMLTITSSAIDNNSVATATPSLIGTDGGGIYNRGTAKVENSTVTNNIGTRGGGISSAGELNIANSTIAGNSGIDREGTAEPDNKANGAGIFGADDRITITSSIIANNKTDISDVDFRTIDPDADVSIEIISNGNNLIGNADNVNGLVDSDLAGTADAPIDPQLGELQNNGGATPTQALLDGSPAINAGSNPNELATDQRGEGFDRTAGEGTDIGAFEVQAGDNGGGENTSLVVSILEDENDGDFSEGDLSLREAIALAESGDTITFDPDLGSGTIVLNDGELVIDKSLTIQGLGAENIIVDADGSSSVFNIDDGNADTQIDVSLNGLAITGAGGNFDRTDSSSSFNGGGISNSENLELNNADIYNNEAVSGGAGISSSGTLTINDSSIYENSVSNPVTDARGGGISSSGTLTVNNSAIYSNSAFSESDSGGAFGGGIINAGTATVNQSTISKNGVAGRINNGGGIANEGDLTITNSTIGNNSSNLTGGIVNGGEVTVTSTIIANVGNNNINGDDFTSGGNNFISGEAETNFRGVPVTISAEGFTNGENGDIVGTLENPIDPLLGELQDNGGSTPTQALLDGSPAINAGSNPNELATDQRGEGFDRTIGEATDIGAFEVQSNDPGGADNDNTIATANDSGISPDGQQNVVINDDVSFNSDVDLFKLELEAKDVATFNIEASEIGSSLDSVVRVFDADGNALALDDDSDAPFEPSSLDSYFEYQPKTNGVYYVGVSSYSNFDYDPVNGGDSEGFSSGDYDLAISVFNNVDGTDSADNLNGTAEADLMEGFGGNDRLIGGRSNDRLLGAGGNDALYGGDGDDLLQGEAGFDVLRGGNGNDTLGGGVGQNKLFGGNGNDVLAIGQGEDVINDFQDSEDKLLLTGDLELLVFEDLTIFDTGRDVITISLNDTTYATLTGVSAEQITADDFVSSDFLSSNSIADDRAEIIAK